MIALPDGHVSMELQHTETVLDMKFVDFPPDGPPRVVWREAEAPEVRVHALHQFMVGPRY